MEGSLQGDRALFQPVATETRDVPRLGVPKATIFPPGVQTLTVRLSHSPVFCLLGDSMDQNIP